jgi:hypothetical protein
LNPNILLHDFLRRVAAFDLATRATLERTNVITLWNSGRRAGQAAFAFSVLMFAGATNSFAQDGTVVFGHGGYDPSKNRFVAGAGRTNSL